MITHIVESWAQDRFAHVHDSLMIADTNTDVAALNQAAQTWLAERGLLTPTRPTVDLHDDTHAGPGDIIVTRHNDRTLMASDGATTVKNRMRWTVIDITDTGDMTVKAATGTTLTLPQHYVSRHVELGYAVTNHGAQGITVDTAHYLTHATGNRSAAYPAMTRGRLTNRVWVSDAVDDHDAAQRLATMVATAPEVASAHQTIDQQWATLDKPADVVRAIRDMTNSYDALRYTIACNNAGLSLKDIDHKGQIYQQLRAGEHAGLSVEHLTRLTVEDLKTLDRPQRRNAPTIAAIMADHIHRTLTLPDPDQRPLKGLTTPDLDTLIHTQHDHTRDLETRYAQLAHDARLDPHPITMPDGTVRPSWAERDYGDLEQHILDQRIATHQHRLDGLDDLITYARRDLAQTQDTFAQLNTPGNRLHPDTATAARNVTQARDTLGELTHQRNLTTQQLDFYLAEQHLRDTMNPTDRHTEDAQRAYHSGRSRADIITARAAHMRAEELTPDVLAHNRQALAIARTERDIRDHLPDLDLHKRPRWDHYQPVCADPHLPAEHAATLTRWQHFLDQRLHATGAAIALNPDRPAWTNALGPIPDATTAPDLRQQWEHLAGRIDAYRDLTGWTNPNIILPTPSNATTALPTDTTTDLHTLRADLSDLRKATHAAQPADQRRTNAIEAAINAGQHNRQPAPTPHHQPERPTTTPTTKPERTPRLGRHQ